MRQKRGTNTHIRFRYGVMFMRTAVALLALTAPLLAQEVLTLRQAVQSR